MSKWLKGERKAYTLSLNKENPELRALRLAKGKEATRRSRAKITKGLCKAAIHCGKVQTGNSNYCFDHWIKQISRGYSNKNNRANPLDLSIVKSLWEEQRGLCALTGIPLIPGDTATIDHIIPVSKGGTGKKDNLRFIHSGINLFKKVDSDYEFASTILNLCPSLISWAQDYLNPNKITYLFQGN